MAQLEARAEPITATESASEAASEPAEAPTPGPSEETALAVPTVNDGVMGMGEDCIEVRFEWDSVEGADGYEVSMKNKFCEEESYRAPEEITETTDTFYVATAQDDFDFQIKVRAYKGTGDSRVYSEWSTEATGSSYEKK